MKFTVLALFLISRLPSQLSVSLYVELANHTLAAQLLVWFLFPSKLGRDKD
jgi:hypothetical protein